MLKYSIKSVARNLFGRKVKQLRKDGLTPANIFGKKIKSKAISLKTAELKDIYSKAGETQMVDLDGKPVLISNMQLDPVSDQILHVDLRQVDLSEKISAKIPVEISGESPAEKQGIGTVVQQMNEIEVEALPTDLPEKIEIDSSNLIEVDQIIFVKDIKLGSKVSLVSDSEQIVVKVEPPQKEEVVEVPVATPAEGEAVEEDKTAPVEGEQAEVKEEATNN